MVDLPRRPLHARTHLSALPPVADLLAERHPDCRCCSACRWRGYWPGPLPRTGPWSAARPAPAGAAAGRRRRGTAHRVQSPGTSRRAPLRLVRRPAHLLDRRGGLAEDLRGAAVLRDHRRGRTALDGPSLREATTTLGARPFTVFRRVTLPMVAPSMIAGAVLSWARALGGVRRDDHLRRQHRRTDPDAASGDLPGARDRPGRGRRAPSLVLLAVSLTVIVSMRDRWLGAS